MVPEFDSQKLFARFLLFQMSFISNMNEYEDADMIETGIQSNYNDADDLYLVVEDE